jgi:LysR family transcriptional regulator, transcriptional activator of the cysJI operon
MTLRHLEVFLAVCDANSMTRAAKTLYLSQPSVSLAIAELETEYGVKLFERLNHRLYLTTAGERLKSYARHILNLNAQAYKELSDLRQGGNLRLGGSLTTGTYLLPGLVVAFRAAHPDVDVFTQIDNTNVIEKLILEDRLDLGLVEGPTFSPDIVERTIRDDRLVVICSPRHPLASRKKVAAADLSGASFIIREPGSGTRLIYENALLEAGVAWKTAGIYNNTESIKHAVQADLGLAVVSLISIEEEVRLGLLVPLDIPDMKLTRKFKCIYHRQKFFTPAMQALLDVLLASK